MFVMEIVREWIVTAKECGENSLGVTVEFVFSREALVSVTGWDTVF
jgi:hypothetical protein